MSVAEQVKKVQETAVSTAKDIGGQVTVQAKDIGGQVTVQAKDVGGQVAGQAKDIGGQVTVQAKDIGGQVTVQAKDIGGQVAGQAKDISAQVPEALRQLDVGTAVAQLRDQAKGVDVQEILDDVHVKVKAYEQPMSEYVNSSAARTRESIGTLLTSLVGRVKEQFRGLGARQTEVVVEVVETEVDVHDEGTPSA